MWAPDNSRSSCPRCGLEFGWAKRRHHCYSCGTLACHDCAPYFVPIPDEDLVGKPSASIFSSIHSGVHRCCHSCYHKKYCWVACWDPLIGSVKAEIYPTELEAKTYVLDTDQALVMHGATARVTWTSPNCTASMADKLIERGKGKMRKECGEEFYQRLEAQHAAGAGGASALRPVPLSSKLDLFNNGQTQQRTNAAAAAAAAASVPPAFAPAAVPSSSSGGAAAAAAAASAHSSSAQLPQFTYCAVTCLADDLKRYRFLQIDIYPNKQELVAEITKLGAEEFAVPSSNPDREGHTVEAIVLLDTDWKTVLYVETAKWHYRSAPYVESVIQALRTKERFVLCRYEGAGRGGGDQCSLVLGHGDLALQLANCAQRGVSAVAVAATGEPVAHSCPDVGLRRQLISGRADVEALKLFYGQAKAAFVATTVPSANADLRPADSLFDIEQQTAGRLRTTVQAWVFDAQLGDKRCIIWPFLSGNACPLQAPPGVQSLASGRLRTAAAVQKGASAVPAASSSSSAAVPAPAAAAAASSYVPSATAAAAAASSSSSPTKAPAPGLAAAPPRPGEQLQRNTQQQQPAPSAAATAPAPECDVCFEKYNTTDRKPLILPCCGNSICSACDAGLIRPRVCPMDREALPDKLVPNRTLLNALQ